MAAKRIKSSLVNLTYDILYESTVCHLYKCPQMFQKKRSIQNIRKRVLIQHVSRLGLRQGRSECYQHEEILRHTTFLIRFHIVSFQQFRSKKNGCQADVNCLPIDQQIVVTNKMSISLESQASPKKSKVQKLTFGIPFAFYKYFHKSNKYKISMDIFAGNI